MIDQRRVRPLNSAPAHEGPVVYWMSRDQRLQDNWALLMTEQIAREQKQPMAVVFCLVPGFLGATIRQYGFLLRGLEGLEQACRVKGIPFFLLMGSPEEVLPAFVKKWKVGTIVCDFDPLRVKRAWKDKLSSVLKIPLLEVDAHNVVPCWVASPKQEFGAYTLRPKIKKLLPEFLTEFPVMRKPAVAWPHAVPEIDWKRVWKSLEVNQEIGEVDWIKPGEKEAHRALKAFLEERLGKYDEDRNDPTKQGQSDLSPYLHFGQLSAQRVALAVREYKGVSSAVKEAFLEELIVRREIADNFCWYQRDYDSVAGFPFWAQKTLGEHRQDEREFMYSQKEFDRAETHDPLWNAAQQQMMQTGKMHGFMRMYWAKKILEWTDKPEDAMKIAIYLNDTYELDGRDPNGYTGIAWSIGGVHDRAWASRKVFGMIRYMNFNGCKRKFDVEAYIKRWGG